MWPRAMGSRRGNHVDFVANARRPSSHLVYRGRFSATTVSSKPQTKPCFPPSRWDAEFRMRECHATTSPPIIVPLAFPSASRRLCGMLPS